jgi:hypothetical protein
MKIPWPQRTQRKSSVCPGSLISVTAVTKRPLPPSDSDLFREAVADAVPLANDRVHHEPPLPPAIPRQHLFDEAAALDESLHGPVLIDLYLEGGDEAAWKRDSLPKAWLRDLRRGRWVTQDKLDLHGMNRDQARTAVVDVSAPNAGIAAIAACASCTARAELAGPRTGAEETGAGLAQPA